MISTGGRGVTKDQIDTGEGIKRSSEGQTPFEVCGHIPDGDLNIVWEAYVTTYWI